MQPCRWLGSGLRVCCCVVRRWWLFGHDEGDTDANDDDNDNDNDNDPDHRRRVARTVGQQQLRHRHLQG